jgi:hypothetical protein
MQEAMDGPSISEAAAVVFTGVPRGGPGDFSIWIPVL